MSETLATGEAGPEVFDFSEFKAIITTLRNAHWKAKTSDSAGWPAMLQEQARILNEMARASAEWLIKSRGVIGVNNGRRTMTHGDDDFGVFKALYDAMWAVDRPKSAGYDTGINSDCRKIAKLTAGYAVQMLLAQLEGTQPSGGEGRPQEVATEIRQATGDELRK